MRDFCALSRTDHMVLVLLWRASGRVWTDCYHDDITHPDSVESGPPYDHAHCNPPSDTHTDFTCHLQYRTGACPDCFTVAIAATQVL